MDYLDELDDSAFQAFAELGGGIDISLNPALSTATISRTSPPPISKRHRRIEATYLLRLEPPFCSPRDIANILKCPRVPRLEDGSGEDGAASFCYLSQSELVALESWMSQHYPGQKVTKIRLGIAHMDSGELPVLGRDPTLPQFKRSVHCCTITIDEKHDGFDAPVYYFFYGTLADPARLSRLFDIPESELQPLQTATLLDGQVRIWADKYRALVDFPGGKVQGFVYSVMSVDEEDALRVYEGDSYEVVRTRVLLGGSEVEARTFRFLWFEDELSGC